MNSIESRLLQMITLPQPSELRQWTQAATWVVLTRAFPLQLDRMNALSAGIVHHTSNKVNCRNSLFWEHLTVCVLFFRCMLYNSASVYYGFKMNSRKGLDMLHGNTDFCTGTWDTVKVLVSLSSP